MCFLFLFHDPAPTEIYTLSLHDALPIFSMPPAKAASGPLSAGQISPRFCSLDAAVTQRPATILPAPHNWPLDRKSTRLNSSHLGISYAVFCLKKKKK